jgi:hypothetical protein
VTDITLGSYGVLDRIIGWEVSLEPSLSDHRHILFTVWGTNWSSSREGLRERLERRPEMNMKDEAGLGLAVHWIQQALISAYEDNCPLRPARKGRKSLRWTSELRVPQKRSETAV